MIWKGRSKYLNYIARGMMRNYQWSRFIADTGFSEFRRQLKYKADARGGSVFAGQPLVCQQQDMFGTRFRYAITSPACTPMELS